MQNTLNIKDLQAQNALAAIQREQAVQSNLARLLATENIHVAFRKAPTASFNVKTRVLTIPIFSSALSKELVQMLVAHEVGHALWTPAEGWHGTVSSRGMVYKGYLNVCEDVRIERKIKIKYPGVNRDFYHGYRELIKNGFFGDLRSVIRNPQALSLADRINLYYKAGPHIPNILFTQEELTLVEAVGETETFEDVLRVTDMVWDYDKKFRQARREEAKAQAPGDSDDPPREQDQDDGEDGIDSLDRDDSQGIEKSDDNEDDLSDMDDEGSEKETGVIDDEDTDEEADADDPSVTGDDEGDALAEGDDDSDDAEEGDEDEDSYNSDGAGGDDVSLPGEDEYVQTDRIFREKESELVDPSCRDIIYATLANPLTEKQVKIPYKYVLAACQKSFTENLERDFMYYGGNRIGVTPAAWAEQEEAKFHAEFRKTHERYITHLVREFELKRNAWTSARTREARGGTLNLNKMYQYKYNEDLFKKVSIVPNGKNHGMIMIIDTSGSMGEALPHVLEQAAVLAMFCRRVQIPFRVYGFTNPGFTEVERAYGFKQERIKPRANRYSSRVDVSMANLDAKIEQEQFALTEFFSDRMTLRDFNKALFFMISKASQRYGGQQILMSSTPLNDTILVIPSMVKALREETKVDKVSVVVLTDGQSDWSNFNVTNARPASHRVMMISPWNRKAFEVMPVTRRGFHSSDSYFDSLCFTKTYIQMAADASNATIVGYHIVPGRKAAGMLSEYDGFYTKSLDDMKMDFRNNKMMSIDKFGYSQYFIMWDKALSQEDKTLDRIDGDMTVRKMASVFNDMQKSRQVNRVFLTKFVSLIA